MRTSAEPIRAASRIRTRCPATYRRAARAAAAKRQRDEEALIEAARADVEAVSRGRPTLLSQLSHDLRNPVSVLTLNLPLLERALPPDHPARRQIDILRRVGDELTQMLDNTSDAARVDRGDLTVQLGLHPVAAMIGDALRAVQRNAQLKELTLDVDVAPDLPPALCDRDRVVRALVNVLSRAVRVSPKKGKITVHAEPDAEGLRLTITDRGQPIPDEHHDAAFELPTDEHQRLAVGNTFVLDLFAARGIVEAQGGTITAERNEPRGTTFVITLPGDSD